MSNDAVITLSIKDEGTPVLAASRTKVREAVEGMAGSLRIVETASKATQAELERSFTAAQQRWAAAATQTTQAARQVETALTAEQQAARAAASAREGLVRSAIAEQQAWRQMNEVRAETANRLAVEERAVRAAAAGYDQSAGFLEKRTASLGDESGKAAVRLGALSRGLNTVTSAIPDAGGALNDFVQVAQSAGPAVGVMVTALGLAVKAWMDLRQANLAYSNAAEMTTIAMSGQRATLMATFRKLDADLLGDRVKTMQAEAEIRSAALETERKEGIARARQKFEESKSILDTVEARAAKERLMELEIDAVHQASGTKRRLLARETSVELQKYAKETADAHRAAEVARMGQEADFEFQIAERRRTNDVEQLAAQARLRQATVDRMAVEMDAEGRVAEAIHTRAAAGAAMLNQEREAFAAAQDAKVRAAQQAYEKIGRKEGVTIAELEEAADAAFAAFMAGETLKARKAEETDEKKRALLIRSATEERNYTAGIAALYADLARRQVASAQEVLTAQVQAGQAAAERQAALLEDRGFIEAAGQIRLKTIQANSANELNAFRAAQQDRVQAEVDAAARILATKSASSQEYIAQEWKLVQVFADSRDKMAAKELETAEKRAKAVEDSERAIRATVGGTADIIQKLIGASDIELRSLRAVFAGEEAQKLRDRIDQLRTRFPEIAGAAQKAAEQVNRALDLVAKGGAKNLSDALDQVAGKLQATAAAASAVARAAFGFNFGPQGFFGGQSKLPSEGGGFFPPPAAAPGPPPEFARGGRVPGPIGMPQWAVVHGGETYDAAGRGGGRAVVINIDARGQDARAIAREIERLRERGALD
jgi:hypothetical protein